MTLRWITALAAAALLLAACGGGDTDRTKAQLRLVNASDAYAALDLRVDDQVRQGGVAYGAGADYVEVDTDKADSVITRSGSATALLSFTPAVARGKYYTVLAFGAEGALRQMPIDDNVGAPESGRTVLRVVNAAPDAGALDIYLTGADEPLASAVPVRAGAAFGVEGSLLTVDSATWRLRVTAAGSKTDLRLDLSALALGSRRGGDAGAHARPWRRAHEHAAARAARRHRAPGHGAGPRARGRRRGRQRRGQRPRRRPGADDQRRLAGGRPVHAAAGRHAAGGAGRQRQRRWPPPR